MTYSRPTHYLSLIAASIMLALPTVALAQVPTTVDPGRILDRLDRGARSTSSKSVVIERSGDDAAPAKGDTNKVFTLSRIVLQNSSVYGEAGPQEAYQKWVGQSVSFADLQAIAQAMTAHYRNEGYILSRVVLSPQKISGGVVTYKAVEGYIDAVEITGETSGDRALLESYAKKIKAERPLNAKTLERYILLMDDLPGVTARSVLKASSAQQGASTLTIQLKDDRYDVALQADNRGNKFIGQYQLQALAAYNSAFGIYDRNTFRLLGSSDFEELRYGEFTNELQLGNEGTQLITRIASARTEPGSTLSALEIEGETNLIEIAVEHPLIRSRTRNLFGRGEFRAQNSKNESLGSELFNDQVRHFALGLDFDAADSWAGINRINATITQGLDVLGATEDGANRSRTDGEHEFTKLGASVSRVQDITDSVSLFGLVNGQVSNDPLLTSEQFGVGGASVGRAFDGAELLGDHGFSGVIELRYRGIPEGESIVQSYEPYIFYDGGTVWLKNPGAGEEKRESLTSTGVGTRFNLVGDYSGSMELSLPLTRDVASKGDDDARFFFNLSKRF